MFLWQQAVVATNVSIYFPKIMNQNPFRKTSSNQLEEVAAAATRSPAPAVTTNLKDYYLEKYIDKSNLNNHN